MTTVLVPLLPVAIWLAQTDEDRFASTKEGARVIALEQAMPAPALKAQVAMQELRGGKVTATNRCFVSIERPLRFRMEVTGGGASDASDVVISNGRWIVHFVPAENRYQLEEATPFSVCSYLPPVIGFAALPKPRDWFRSQEGLALGESDQDDVLMVDVNGVPGKLHLGKQDHLPKLLELKVDDPGAGPDKLVTRIEALEQRPDLPAATFLFEPPAGASEEPPSEAPEPPLLALGSTAPTIAAHDLAGVPRSIAPTSSAPRIVLFWFEGGAQSAAELEALVALAAAQQVQLVAIHCGDLGDAARSRMARVGGQAVLLQDDAGPATAAAAWRVAVFPTTYVVAADGKVLDRLVGRGRERLEKALRSARN
ncbi:MAG: hypothetical protein U1E76_03945 [Planctomycetota bacterium]